jgi:acetyl esterase
MMWVIVLLFGWNLYAKDSACQPPQEIGEVLKLAETAGNPLDHMTRESAPALWLKRELDARKILAPIPVSAVRDVAIPARNRQIPVRIYSPVAKPQEKLPILIYVHGGGWTLGSITTYDSITRTLANRIPAIVVSIDYRLAPEFPYPAGLEDVHLATEWVARNATDLGGDPSLIGIAGDSGGGNLATVVARRAKHAGINLVFQALFYPSTDIGHMDYPSYAQFGTGFLLTKKSVELFRGFYVRNPKDWTNSEVSPLLADKKELALLPPTLVIVAGCDPLKDEGIAYAKKLEENGVKVVLRQKENLPHGFLGYYNSNQKLSRLIEPILTEISDEIRKGFASAR